MLSTLILWSKTFYTTIGQYPTLNDFLAIAPKENISLELLPNVSQQMCQIQYFPTYMTTPLLYVGEMSQHMQ